MVLALGLVFWSLLGVGECDHVSSKVRGSCSFRCRVNLRRKLWLGFV